MAPGCCMLHCHSLPVNEIPDLLNFTVVRWPLRRYSYTAALCLNNLLILLLLRFGCKPCNSSRKNEKLGKSRKAPRSSRTVWDDHQGPAGRAEFIADKSPIARHF